jgi:metal-responsive CopG/Arc/MetJ family transcriptional regulator
MATVNHSMNQRRVAIRLPSGMMKEIDRVVRDHPELNYNRQQFVESAVREKIERTIIFENAKASSSFVTVNNRLRPLY